MDDQNNTQDLNAASTPPVDNGMGGTPVNDTPAMGVPSASTPPADEDGGMSVPPMEPPVEGGDMGVPPAAEPVVPPAPDGGGMGEAPAPAAPAEDGSPVEPASM